MIRVVSDSAIKILYLGGYGRSGSTLLGRMLGEPAGTVCVGETRFLWSRGLMSNVDCGCGLPFRSCPFWGAVGEEAFGGWDQIDAEWLTELDRVTNLPQSLPYYWAPWLRPGMSDKIAEYVTVLSSLYGAIIRVSGAGTIIETSKEPTFACLLRRMPGSDVRVVHLIRDSRAVAYSWMQKRRMPSPIGDEEFMSRSGPVEAANKWFAWNMGCYALSVARFPYLRCTYEGFVEDPRALLDRLAVFADEPLISTDIELKDKEVKLGAHHIFSGNPMRATTGWVPVRPDNKWQTGLTTSQFAKVTAITWPLLCLNGYSIMARGRKSASAVVGASAPD